MQPILTYLEHYTFIFTASVITKLSIKDLSKNMNKSTFKNQWNICHKNKSADVMNYK